jgi:hypothetical protein
MGWTHISDGINKSCLIILMGIFLVKQTLGRRLQVEMEGIKGSVSYRCCQVETTKYRHFCPVFITSGIRFQRPGGWLLSKMLENFRLASERKAAWALCSVRKNMCVCYF